MSQRTSDERVGGETAPQAEPEVPDLSTVAEGELADRIRQLRTSVRLEEAQRLVNEAPKEFRRSARILYEEGMINFDLKNHDLAIRNFEEAVEADRAYQPPLEWRALAIADKLRLGQRFSETERVIQGAEHEFPKSVHVVNQHGLVHYDQKHYQQALECFRRGLGLEESPFADQWRLLAESALLRSQRRFPRAEALIQGALEGRMADNDELLAELGRIHLDWAEDEEDERSHVEKAEHFFERALETGRAEVHLQLNIVELEMFRGNRERALQLLVSLRAMHPGDILVREDLGEMYIRRGDLVKAEREFAEFRAEHPENIGAVAGHGAALFYLGRYREAEECLRRACEEAPEHPVFLSRLAAMLIRGGGFRDELNEAEDLCDRALRIDPARAQALGCKGIIAFRRGQMAQAERYFVESIRVNPRKGHYADLGALYGRLGRFEEAKEQLLKALRIYSGDVRARMELGTVYLGMGKIGPAIEQLRAAHEMDPSNDEAARRLAEALGRRGELEEAERVLRRTIDQLDPSRGYRLHLELSRLLVGRGDETRDRGHYHEALTEVRKAIDVRPGDSDALFHRGVVRTKLDDYEGALRDFKSVVRIDQQLSESDDEEERQIRYDPVRHADAVRYRKMLTDYLTKDAGQSRTARLGSLAVAVLSVAQLAYLWVLYYQGKVDGTFITVMVPVLLGLFIISFLLPQMIRLKMPGFEAEMQPAPKPSPQPIGQVTFSSSSPSLSSGPR